MQVRATSHAENQTRETGAEEKESGLFELPAIQDDGGFDGLSSKTHLPHFNAGRGFH